MSQTRRRNPKDVESDQEEDIGNDEDDDASDEEYSSKRQSVSAAAKPASDLVSCKDLNKLCLHRSLKAPITVDCVMSWETLLLLCRRATAGRVLLGFLHTDVG